jgi:hypothetical protein
MRTDAAAAGCAARSWLRPREGQRGRLCGTESVEARDPHASRFVRTCIQAGKESAQDNQRRSRLRGRNRWRGGSRISDANRPAVRCEHTSTFLSCASSTHPPRMRIGDRTLGEPANRAASWRHFGDEAGFLRAKSKSEERDSGGERQGSERDANRSQVVVFEEELAGRQGFGPAGDARSALPLDPAKTCRAA